MTYEEFLTVNRKEFKTIFSGIFSGKKSGNQEVLKNNNIKLQGVYLSGSHKLHIRSTFISGILLSGT